MKNKENHGEKQFYNEAFNISSSVSIYLVDVERSDGVQCCGTTCKKIDSQTYVILHAFRHQQSDLVALPILLFGHNYRGFVGTIEWLI